MQKETTARPSEKGRDERATGGLTELIDELTGELANDQQKLAAVHPLIAGEAAVSNVEIRVKAAGRDDFVERKRLRNAPFGV